MPKVIATHSYRGGTGKSNFTANLAAAVALQGNRVAIIDTDLQSPGVHILFGIQLDEPGAGTLNDYLWGRAPIENTAHDVSAALRNDGEGRLFLVPASLNTNEISRILSEGYDVSLLMDGCSRLIDKLNLDYLFIDTHPGLSKESFLSIAMANILLLILRPDQQDFQGTAVTVDVAKELQLRHMMLILNKVLTRINAESLRDKVEETYGIPVAGLFPLSEDMAQLGSKGLFCVEYPAHPLTAEFLQVAKQITGLFTDSGESANRSTSGAEAMDVGGRSPT